MNRQVKRTCVLLGVLSVCLVAASRGAEARVPDLTRGDKPEITPAKTDRYLHLNGARGWVYLDEKKRSAESRQIYITRVPPGSYGEDVIRVGDVIVGVNGKDFTSDALVTFREAIADARRPGRSRFITITRWRDGARSQHRIQVKPPPPDFTKGGKPDETHDWTLGPTGARGWIYAKVLETINARQILVTEVAPASPADGVLEVGDVILGVAGRKFESDARKVFARAVTEAERTANGGLLRLVVWRDGVERDVTVRLEVMGEYSETAPYICVKTARIVDGACAYLERNGIGDGIVGHVNALGLMATGRHKYDDVVRAHARKVAAAGESLKLSCTSGMAAWNWGYANLFLTEYYLATGDPSVLPAIREYSTKIAMGQSGVGSWGHGMAWPDRGNLGRLHGRLGGYGALNQAGLICFMSLALARNCGVEDAEIDKAIEKAVDYYGFFVGKGSIPYGDHAPGTGAHDDNGKCSIGAVVFNILGLYEGATFFSRMTVASYNVREAGHTGNYWSFLWGPLAAGLSGPEATAAFMKELRWFFDMERRHDGGFVYQGAAGMGGAEHQYPGWDCTGARLLAYCMPLRRLYITGRGESWAALLERRDLEDVVAAGRGVTWSRRDGLYDDSDTRELLELLRSWSPVVRERAAMSLAKKPDAPVAGLIAMLEDPDANAMEGACRALEKLGGRAAHAVDALLDVALKGELGLRIRALHALGRIGAPARKALPRLMRLAVTPDPKDPRRQTQRALCECLFRLGNGPGLVTMSLEGVDRRLLRLVVEELLTVDDGRARGCVADVFDLMSFDELAPFWPAILKGVREPAPSGVMFASEVRLAGLQLLSRNSVREGIPVIVKFAFDQNAWASQERMYPIMKALMAYEAAAKVALPDLERLHAYCLTQPNFPQNCRVEKAKAVKQAIDYIRKATRMPTMVGIGSGDQGER